MPSDCGMWFSFTNGVIPIASKTFLHTFGRSWLWIENNKSLIIVIQWPALVFVFIYGNKKRPQRNQFRMSADNVNAFFFITSGPLDYAHSPLSQRQSSLAVISYVGHYFISLKVGGGVTYNGRLVCGGGGCSPLTLVHVHRDGWSGRTKSVGMTRGRSFRIFLGHSGAFPFDSGSLDILWRFLKRKWRWESLVDVRRWNLSEHVLSNWETLKSLQVTKEIAINMAVAVCWTFIATWNVLEDFNFESSALPNLL